MDAVLERNTVKLQQSLSDSLSSHSNLFASPSTNLGYTCGMRVTSGLIVAAGCYNLAFAIFHLLFWRLFRWPQQLPRLNAANAGIMQVLNLCLAYVFVVAAMLCFWFGAELGGTELGQFVLVALAIFWAARAVYQPMFFGLSHPFSVALFGIFILGAAIHAAAWWTARGGGL